jgi:hypothetical protein
MKYTELMNFDVPPTPPIADKPTGPGERIAAIPKQLALMSASIAYRTVDNRIKNTSEGRPLDIRLMDSVIARLLPNTHEHGLDLSPEEEAQALQELSTLYREAPYWHGTGRYQYRNGKVIDVLQTVMDEGDMRTNTDTMDVVTGEMESISTAPSRMYARIYADMHRDRDQPLSYRFGSANFWASYFLAPMGVDGALELGRKLLLPDKNKELVTALNQGIKGWRGKINATPRNPKEFGFVEGSDIAGNYPILIGLDKDSLQEAPISRTIARHERRSSQNISLDGMTHLEVPLDYVEETHELVKDRLHVTALELGEHYCAHFPFSELVSGRALDIEEKAGQKTFKSPS